MYRLVLATVLVLSVFAVRSGLAAVEDAPVLTPDILLVPLLAFDMNGFRLGYGAGFYDRTLAGLRAKGRVTAIGVAFDEQQVEAVPRDAYDEALDWVLTQYWTDRFHVSALTLTPTRSASYSASRANWVFELSPCPSWLE